MAYLEQGRRASPGSMAAVVAIHAGAGLALVWGLTVTGVIEKDDRITAINIDKKDPPPPTPVEPQTQPKAGDPVQAQTQQTRVVAPDTAIDLPLSQNTTETTNILSGGLDPINPGTLDPIMPSPTPTFDPVRAAPRNNPGMWVTTADYRSSWIRREMVGTASFRLEIAANGRVESCTITRSTGHSALDTATCKLVTQRAKFEPARGELGEAVSGTYANSVKWELPD